MYILNFDLAFDCSSNHKLDLMAPITVPPRIDLNDINNERSEIKGQPHFVAQAPFLPFNLLSDRQFEILAFDLLREEMSRSDLGYDNVVLMPYGADKGRDVVLYSQQQAVGVIQCKRYDANIGLLEVLAELSKFILFSRIHPSLLPQADGFRYELWTAKDLTEKAKEFFASPQKIISEELVLLSDQIDKVRRRVRSLANVRIRENRQAEAIEIANLLERFSFRHVGNIEIGRRLSIEPDVRRWFFRGPDDNPNTPTRGDVQRLVQQLMSERLRESTSTGKAGGSPFVAPSALEASFASFLESGAKVLGIAGGSGHGKTTWSARRLESQQSGLPVTLIRGEDISASDQTIIGTLARLVSGQRLGEIRSDDLQGAIWDWVDSENRLFIVDGIDRVPYVAREALSNWIIATVVRLADGPVRLVITGRLETWSVNWPQLEAIRHFFYSASNDRIGVVQLGQLSREEARDVYAAYGLPDGLHRYRPLRTPSLISNYAKLRERFGEAEVVTRFDVFKARVEEACADVMRRSAYGQMACAAFLVQVGLLLSESVDGSISIEQLTQAFPESIRIVDQFALANLVLMVGSRVRTESDEVAEYIIGSQLDLGSAPQELYRRGANPLYLGGLGMAFARLERENVAQARSFFCELIDLIDGDRGVHFEAAARIAVEVRNHQSIESELRKLLSFWRSPNFLLIGSNLGELIGDIHLAPVDRLTLLMLLVEGEELDDWRSKFWLDPSAYGRMVTPFATAAVQAVKEDACSAMSYLQTLIGEEGKVSTVARGLTYEAASVDPTSALKAFWPATSKVGSSIFSDLVFLYPEEAASFLLQVENHDRSAEILWSSAKRVRSNLEAESGWRGVLALSKTASYFLDSQPKPAFTKVARVKLLLCSLLGEADPVRQAELASFWDEIGIYDVWQAIQLSGDHCNSLIANFLEDIRLQRGKYEALGWISLGNMTAKYKETVFELLADVFASTTREVQREISLAVEALLYENEDKDPASWTTLLALAQIIARSPYADVRKPLIYFSGTPASEQGHSSETIIKRRDAIFEALIQNEDGPNLSDVVWKILQSASERGAAFDRLNFLARRMGLERVLERSSIYEILYPDAKTLISALRAEWRGKRNAPPTPPTPPPRRL